MTDLTEHMAAMRALVDGGLRGEDRVQFIDRMRAYMISVAAYLLANQQPTFRDLDVFLPKALVLFASWPGRAEANAVDSGFAQYGVTEVLHPHFNIEEEPSQST
jgi:hypothetical protein